MSTSRRKRAAQSPPGPSSKTRAASSDANVNTSPPDADSVLEVVDLTSETSEAVVDLTHNDSVLLVEEGPQARATTGASYVVSSDEDEAMPPTLNPTTLSSTEANSADRWIPGVISCPVCMDSYSEIVDSGRLVVSTKCGHVFCSQCLRDALTSSHTCPTCRKRVTSQQYHPLYL